ncbi:isocitrate lyase/PEP mutase family protein [Salinithrix halophila]|uniref:Isocitrate lyase/phosphoenolpyruvate mutase family protein n=1 Tax=Salinithrix halophila TaxID=1485204 RepID=A0ABV8JM75_9BACL
MDRHKQARYFRDLHLQPEILVLPNAWDAVSAIIYEQTGFSAIGTTSAGIAASLGYPDGEYIPREQLLAYTRRMVDSVKVPVTADIVGGYGPGIDQILDTVRGVIDCGAVGINIEDGLADNKLEDLQVQANKIDAIRRLADRMNFPLVINARIDLYWLSIGDREDRLNQAIRRANVYIEAGADCAFVPGVYEPSMIKELVTGIRGPLNLLAGPQSPDTSQLEKLGVSRVSMGSGPIRAVLAHVRKISEELYHHGTYTSISDQIPYSQVNQWLEKK